MAINYLNTVNLNSNQLENAAIQNLATDPSAGVLGQVYYNTTINELKICTTAGSPTGAVWTTVGSYDYWVLDADGQGTTANITNGMTADFVGGLKITTDSTSGGTLNIVHDTQAQTDTTSTAAPSYGGTFTTVDTVTRDSTGHVTGINVKTVTLPTIAYDLNKAAASGNLVLGKDGTAQDTIVFAGTPDEIEIDIATEDSYTFGFPAAGVVLPDGSTATTQATGDNSTKVATTAFVQASVTGLLEFKGGFNANTGDIVGGGNLTSGAARVAVAVGDYYVVTVDGNFFGNTATPLTVGDSVIVQTAAVAGASVEADFIVVQSDTDLATATTVGLGNVVPGTSATVTAPYTNGTAAIDVVDSTASQKGAVIVAQSTDGNLEGIDLFYSSGTATVGLDIQGLTEDDGTGDAIINFYVPFFNSPDDQNYKITLAQIASLIQTNNSKTGTITAGQLSGTVTHAFGVNTIVQTLDSSGNTVYCDISRTATTSVATIAAAQATDITILVQKIG